MSDDLDVLESHAVHNVQTEHLRPPMMLGAYENPASNMPLSKPPAAGSIWDVLKKPSTIALIGFGVLALILLVMLVNEKKDGKSE